MNINKLNELFHHHPHFKRDEWLKIAHPNINMRFDDELPLHHQSRVGGQAFVPKDFIYPTHENAVYRFLLQINFDEIKSDIDILPKTGLLSLFYVDDETGETECFDDGYILGYYWQNYQDFVRMTPEDLYHDVLQAKKIIFENGIDLPLNRYFEINYPQNKDEFIDVAYEYDDFFNDKLLGYPLHSTLGYDPTPEGFMPLLNLQTHKELNWFWGDGDRLSIFIEPEKLRQYDFSHLKADAG